MSDESRYSIKRAAPQGRLVDPFGRELTIVGEQPGLPAVYRLLTEVLAGAGGRVWVPHRVANRIPSPADVQIAANDKGRAIILQDFEFTALNGWAEVIDEWKRGQYYDLAGTASEPCACAHCERSPACKAHDGAAD